jgi:nitrous oxidase accessory protein NosD
VIYDNRGYGINLGEESKDNNVEKNDFSGNNDGKCQANDDGSNNVFRNNYWSDWTGSGAYAIDGSTRNQDPSSQADPHYMEKTIPKTPGMTGIIVVLSIISILALRKVKRRAK